MNVRNILIYIMSCTVLLSCSTADDMSQNEGTPEALDLLLSIGKTERLTRQYSDVIQEGQAFRGLKSLLVIPFTTTGAEQVTANDVPLISTVSGDNTNKVDNKSYYYFNHCYLMRGTNRVLVYGESADIEGKTTPNLNGKLETTLVDRMLPSDITFNLASIRTTTVVHDDAQALASYMTAIANTDGWSTTDDAQLKGLYLDFIHAESEGTGLMAGSAAHVKAFVAALKTQLQAIGGDLSNAIIANIDDNSTIESNTYPTSIGLPDGAAALRWTGSAFSVRTETTPLDNINGITRWAYPAELWYYANSGIHTSTTEVPKTTYGNYEWSYLLSTYYQGGPTIVSETQSAAVGEPLQYGVGRLQITLNKITGTLSDAKGDNVTYLTASEFPLTAVIIGGQHTVGFDFKPKGPQSDVDARFIYDTVVGDADNNGNYTVNTLVLQSYDNEKVPVILEFQNNTGHQFTGKDGIIYPGTKFYLIAQVDPAGLGEGNYANRVFTQDYTTKMTMMVNSLKNAYSCMPDLLEPRLEIGVEVTTSWIQSTTTTVIL